MRTGGWRVLVVLALVGLLAVGFSGCAGKEKEKPVETPTTTVAITPTQTTTPETTIEDFVTAYNKRDAESLYDLFSSNVKSKHSKEEVESQLELARSMGLKITAWKVESKEVTDGTAILKVNITSYWGGRSYKEVTEYHLIYKNGRWLIDNWPWKEYQK